MIYFDLKQSPQTLCSFNLMWNCYIENVFSNKLYGLFGVLVSKIKILNFDSATITLDKYSLNKMAENHYNITSL